MPTQSQSNEAQARLLSGTKPAMGSGMSGAGLAGMARPQAGMGGAGMSGMAMNAMGARPGMKKGGTVKSASSRADGCAIRGKTRA